MPTRTMKTDEYVILRPRSPTPGAAWRGGGPAPMADPTPATVDRPGPQAHVVLQPPAQTAVEKVELTPGQAKAAQQAEPDATVSLTMPMRLIEPRRTAAKVEGMAAGPTWGVRSVGAVDCPFDGRDVVVAVLDTGIDASHPAFAGVELERRNFTADPDDDSDGHGTHCAATIFGRDVDGVRIGVARGVRRALIGKVIGRDASTGDLARAVNWAVEGGAHIVSMSLGIDFPGHVARQIAAGMAHDLAVAHALSAYRQTLRLFDTLAAHVAAAAAFTQPVLLIAASGNESRRHLSPRHEVGVGPPAVADGFIAVGALGLGAGGLTLADFSNTGSRLCAPGVGVVSARAGGGLATMDGTSMATPHVAGVAALWADKLKQDRAFSLDAWRDRLLGSTTQQGLLVGFDPADVGSGLVQAPRP